MGGKKRTLDQTDIFVGARVRFYRRQKSMSQTDLGGQLGLTFQQVQKYEKGTNRIGAGRLAAIARILGQPIVAFYPVGSQPEAENGVFEMINTPQAMRLLVAFHSMESTKARAALTAMAEEMAGTQQTRKRRAA